MTDEIGSDTLACGGRFTTMVKASSRTPIDATGWLANEGRPSGERAVPALDTKAGLPEQADGLALPPHGAVAR